MEDTVITAPYINEQFFLLAAVVIGIVADGLIVYSIMKFQNMQTKTNLFILNSSLADLLFHISCPIFYLFFVKNVEVRRIFFCVSDELQSMSQFLTCAIIFVMEVDFGHNHVSRRSAKVGLIVLWVVVTLTTVVLLVLCFKHISWFSIFFYLSMFVALVCTHLVKCFCCVYRKLLKMDDNNCPITKFRFLTVSLYLAMRLLHCIIFFILLGYELVDPYILLETVALILCRLNSLANLFLFAYLDKNFKLCFLQAFRCSNNYSDSTISYNNTRRR